MEPRWRWSQSRSWSWPGKCTFLRRGQPEPLIDPRQPPKVDYSPGVGTVWPTGVGTTAGVSATGAVAADVVGVTASEGGVMTALLVVKAGALGVGCPVSRVSSLEQKLT